MNKSLSVITAAACVGLSALALVGCGSPNVKFVGASELNRLPKQEEKYDDTKLPQDHDDGQSAPDGAYEKPVIFGVRRHFKPRHFGTYGVDYVRFPQGEEKDETLDYRLTLKDDDTFELTVVSKGVTAEHYGHYYIRRGGSITLFYDEEIEPTAHNVYICDSLYGEILPNGKIMFYDNCNTIVLAKDGSNDTITFTDMYETDDSFGGFGYYDGYYGTAYGGIALYSAR